MKADIKITRTRIAHEITESQHAAGRTKERNSSSVLGQVMLGELHVELPFPHINTHPNIYTIEFPWCNSLNTYHCIPTGAYPAYIRTDGNLGWRIELVGVPKRANVQIHRGSYESQINGCILPGLTQGTVYSEVIDDRRKLPAKKSLPTVGNATQALRYIKDIIETYDVSELEVVVSEQYPEAVMSF